eukprot:CAMPEP_0113668622 /NCGR_PEP_ID=MMETSP0038_2-20120614/4105_1 /TAXON_ID=2898 /ORGANISM="Cryptomonas paramecium" /LENGTH=331 /DNA_ID=CAMNT_0000584391 /DNA_START=165 /DNA_END=1156 /DNA_ORIENTATION=- /assembly_acc=CAM_ASM_000170
MPQAVKQNGKNKLRSSSRSASPAVEIIARRLLKSKNAKSIVPPELLKKKRDSTGKPGATPKKASDDATRKLNKFAGRIGYYAIRLVDGEKYDDLQVRWSEFRKSIKSTQAIEDLRDNLLKIIEGVHDKFFRKEWLDSKDSCISACKDVEDRGDFQSVIKELEQAINWQKIEFVHELMDICNQIPSSQVRVSDEKFWFEDFPTKLRESDGPNELAQHLRDLCTQIKPKAEIADEEWMQKERNDWIKRCNACDSWPEFKQLMKNFDDDAIDWRAATKLMRRENGGKDEQDGSKSDADATPARAPRTSSAADGASAKKGKQASGDKDKAGDKAG